MTVVLQICAFVILVAAGVGWGHWVWDTNRTIQAPERLSPILVHGLPEADAKALADAVAVGIIGRIAEHKRIVAFINEAAASAESSADIRALTRISQPAPSLIEAARAPKALDVSIEFAGSKVETKGLERFLQFDTPNRGALFISLLLEKRAGNLVGLASSSFPPDSSYGFAVPIEGSTQEIAERIAMRFVQAHYAANDSFYSALDPADFRTLWRIRRRAAEIALRASAGSSTSSDAPLKDEARASYGELAHLVNRYTRRPELQRLGAYLASVSEYFNPARTHLELVKQTTEDVREHSVLDRMISALKTDADAQLASASVSASPGPTPLSQSGVSELELRVLEDPELVNSGVAALAERVRNTPSARIADVVLVLGAIDEFRPFGDRVVPLGPRDRDPRDELLSHTQSVAALIATLAPKAQIRVVKALSGRGSGTKADVTAAVDRAAAVAPEIIVLPLGPFDTVADRAMLERAGRQSLVLIAAGNDGQDLEEAGADAPGVVYVGAAAGQARAAYSNYGQGVPMLAPGSVLTFNGDGELQRLTGTSFSVAVAAAAAANIAALSSARLDPEQLKRKLLENTAASASGGLLRVSAN
jgi:hypothetical protein